MLHKFFDEVYFNNIALIEWIKEVTNGMYICMHFKNISLVN